LFGDADHYPRLSGAKALRSFPSSWTRSMAMVLGSHRGRNACANPSSWNPKIACHFCAACICDDIPSSRICCIPLAAALASSQENWYCVDRISNVLSMENRRESSGHSANLERAAPTSR